MMQTAPNCREEIRTQPDRRRLWADLRRAQRDALVPSSASAPGSGPIAVLGSAGRRPPPLAGFRSRWTPPRLSARCPWHVS